MSQRVTEYINLVQVSREEVEHIADKLGEESAAQQALDYADSLDLPIRFFVGRGTNQYNVCVKPGIR